MIMGVGNILFSDDGIGIRTIEYLDKTYQFPDNVRIVDGGVLGVNLMGVISEADYLIVVDSVFNKGKPGDLYKFRDEQINKRILSTKSSMHQVDLLEALTLCAALPNGIPQTVIIGIEPEDVKSLSVEITKTVYSKLHDLANMVLEELDFLKIKYEKKIKKNYAKPKVIQITKGIC